MRKIKTSSRKRNRQSLTKTRISSDKENKFENISDQSRQLTIINTDSDLANQINNIELKSSQSIKSNSNDLNHQVINETKSNKEILNGEADNLSNNINTLKNEIKEPESSTKINANISTTEIQNKDAINNLIKKNIEDA